MKYAIWGVALLALTACTNGMLGESAIKTNHAQDGSTGGDFTGPPASIAPTEIQIDADVVGTFKDYWATAADPDVGVVVNMKNALINTIGLTKLEDYVTKALTVPEVGDMKVHLDVHAFNTRFTFPFSKLARSYVDNGTTKYQLNNIFVAHPRGKVVFGSLPNAPVSATVFQTVNRDIVILGGRDSDGFEMNQMSMINANGTLSLPNSANPDWGIASDGSGGTMLYRNDEAPHVIPFRFAQELFQAAEMDFKAEPPAVPLLATPSWYGSMYNPVNFAVVQFIPGRPRTVDVSNVLEVSFFIFGGAKPLRATWCNTTHDLTAIPSTNQELYGCAASLIQPPKRANRLEALSNSTGNGAMQRQATGQGAPATSGTSLNVNPTGGITKSAIP